MYRKFLITFFLLFFTFSLLGKAEADEIKSEKSILIIDQINDSQLNKIKEDSYFEKLSYCTLNGDKENKKGTLPIFKSENGKKFLFIENPTIKNELIKSFEAIGLKSREIKDSDALYYLYELFFNLQNTKDPLVPGYQLVNKKETKLYARQHVKTREEIKEEVRIKEEKEKKKAEEEKKKQEEELMKKRLENARQNSSENLDPSKPMVALTYDDGPNPKGSTEQILDVLKKYGARATFFVIGSSAEDNPELLRREIEEGHEIGNHSYNHPDLTTIDKDAFDYQINTTQNIIYQATGIYPKMIRPPYGAIDENTKSISPLPFITWSIDTRDWDHRNPDLVYQNIMDNLSDGDIILMHDIHQSTADACERIVSKLKELGYQMVTVSELMQARGVQMKAGYVYDNGFAQ